MARRRPSLHHPPDDSTTDWELLGLILGQLLEIFLEGLCAYLGIGPLMGRSFERAIVYAWWVKAHQLVGLI